VTNPEHPQRIYITSKQIKSKEKSKKCTNGTYTPYCIWFFHVIFKLDKELVITKWCVSMSLVLQEIVEGEPHAKAKQGINNHIC